MAEQPAPAVDAPPPADTGPEQGPPAENAGPGAGPPPDGADDADRFETIEKQTRSRHDLYQTWIGSAGTIVIGSERPRRHRAGPVDDTDIRAAKQYFLEPPHFRQAVAMIAMSHLVVLCGPEGSGRRCAALVLLDDGNCPGADRDRRIELLEPLTPLDSLLDRDYAPGGRYLQEDYGLTEDPAQTRFLIGRLQARLRDKGAFLVLTTARPAREFGPSAVPGQTVTARQVFEAHAAGADHDATPEQARKLDGVLTDLLLDQVATFIDNLLNCGLDVACAPFRDQARAELHTWLQDRPEVPELVPVVTAALLPDIVESEHERRAEALARRIDVHAGRDRADADYSSALRPGRASGNGVSRRADPSRPGDRIAGLKEGLTSITVLTELHRCYGEELWVPVRDWLHEQPLDGEPRTVEALSTSFAALLRVDLELADRVLRSWATDQLDERR
jgi:hypothetical protein